MNTKHGWMYDELKHSGVDYSDPTQVEVYDLNHQKFRDYEKGTKIIVNALGLGKEDTVIDMGAGTGAFAINSAKYCKLIYAVDVSKAMLDYASQKARKANIDNIVFCHSGFLTYEHDAEPADAMVCVGVLHHLPDFWKLVGLRRSAQMLKPNGKLCLYDVVFPSDLTDYESRFDAWVRAIKSGIGEDFAKEVETHIRDEHSTYDWVMEGLLERAGFIIKSAQYGDMFGATYICERK